jgi:hypothetical protein
MNTIFEDFLKLIFQKIGPYGFHRKGSVFRKIETDFSSIIEFQKSRESTSRELKFTITLGVVSRLLIEDETAFLKAKCVDAHLTERLGGLIGSSGDRWWILRDKNGIEALVDDIGEILISVGVPYLEKYANKNGLTALWESGVSPGLTKIQADRLLKKIKS